ncbi:hypothetical protein LCGC14_2931190, partial [marine sediment metagenome]
MTNVRQRVQGDSTASESAVGDRGHDVFRLRDVHG